LLFVVNVSLLPFLSVALCTRLVDAELPKENLGIVYRLSVFFQNLELKKSVPGSLQHMSSMASLLGILPLDTAKSYDISSKAISRPYTRVSREFIPFWEVPINLYSNKHENTGQKYILP
jgi:hypothetical protein